MLQVTADELTYNGQSLDAIVPQRTAAYISQVCGAWVLVRAGLRGAAWQMV